MTCPMPTKYVPAATARCTAWVKTSPSNCISCRRKSARRSAQTTSYMWVYRSAEGSAQPVVLFDYQPGRGHEHPEHFLKGFTGTLMTDGYAAWRMLKGVTHLGCMAHVRRRFVEALK